MSPPPDTLAVVLGYPPWHTTFFWWLPWLPDSAFALFVNVYRVLPALLLLFYLAKWQPSHWMDRCFFFSCCFMVLAAPYVSIFCAPNYGTLLALLFIPFYEAFKRSGLRYQVFAGLILALMMIKPQCSALLFISLLVNKRFLSVAVAAGVLTLATLWPAYVYGESPVDLVLQISEIGEHYRWHLPGLNLLDNLAPLAIAIVCASICFALSLLFKASPSHMVRLLPALLLFPIWGMYSNRSDWVLWWPLGAFLGLSLLDLGPVVMRGWEKNLVGILLLGTLYDSFLNWSALWEWAGWRIYHDKNYTIICAALLAVLFTRRLWLSRHEPPNPKWLEKPF